MNSDTLWLQVPAATMPLLKPIFPPYHSNKLTHIIGKTDKQQYPNLPYLGRTTIILFVSKHKQVTEGKNNSTNPFTENRIYNYSGKETYSDELTEKLNTKIEIVNLDSVINYKPGAGMVSSILSLPTNRFHLTQAMNQEQLAKAINIGRQAAQRIKLRGSKLFIASEINSANTFPAIAISCTLLNISPENISEINSRDKKLIQGSLFSNKENLMLPLEVLQHFGSFEIAALTGSYLCCAHMGLPVLIDGLASAVAALIASLICPNAEKWFFFSNMGESKVHNEIVERLKIKPLLHTNEKLDKVSSIALSISLLKLSCANYSELMHSSETSDKIYY